MMAGFLDNITISSVFMLSLVASFQTKEQCSIVLVIMAKNGIKHKFLITLNWGLPLAKS